MIIAIADVHLGSQMANKLGFAEFIHEFLEPNQGDISRIVLLGDIMDLWRNSNSKLLLDNIDIMTDLGQLDMKKNYVVGNHDYAIFSILNQGIFSVHPDSTGVVDQVSETLELTSDGFKLRFIHGHQADYWPALQFYEVFSQAMCFVDDDDQDLSDVWNIIYRFAESLPDKTRNLVRELPQDTQNALERKLAGPLDGNLQEEKKGLFYEWELLRKVSDFEDIALMCSKPLNAIEQFAEDWVQLVKAIDHYPERTTLPPKIAIELHQKRRVAASLTAGLKEDEFLIRGHSHTPYVNQEIKVADAGCWLGNKGSYLVIEEDQITLNQW